jgi:hypothetical protein
MSYEIQDYTAFFFSQNGRFVRDTFRLFLARSVYHTRNTTHIAICTCPRNTTSIALLSPDAQATVVRSKHGDQRVGDKRGIKCWGDKQW